MRVIDVISICRFVQFSHGPMAHPHPHQLLLLLSYSQLSRIHQPDLLPPARTHRTHRTHEISLFWKSSCSEYFSLFRTFLESRLKQTRREALRIDFLEKATPQTRIERRNNFLGKIYINNSLQLTRASTAASLTRASQDNVESYEVCCWDLNILQ